MSIFNKETPLKVWHLIVILVAATVIYFAYSTWKQVRINTVNIATIASFLNKANPQQSQPQPIQPKREVPTEKENK